jgi:hypothetical protein
MEDKARQDSLLNYTMLSLAKALAYSQLHPPPDEGRDRQKRPKIPGNIGVSMDTHSL